MGKKSTGSRRKEKKTFYALCCDLNDTTKLKVLKASELYVPIGREAKKFQPKTKKEFSKSQEYLRKTMSAEEVPSVARYHIFQLDGKSS